MDASFRIKPECWGTSFASGSESVMWGTLGENGKVEGDNLSKVKSKKKRSIGFYAHSCSPIPPTPATTPLSCNCQLISDVILL